MGIKQIMNIEKLEQDHEKLQSLKSALLVEIYAAECELSKTFTTGTGTDKKAADLSLLKTKATALDKAIDDSYQAIKQAELDEVIAKQDVIVAKRKQAVIDALRANEKAIKLSESLAKEIAIFTEKALFAGADSAEVTAQPRIILGKLALQFNILGGLTGAAVLPLLTSDDAERIQSKIN